jgi:two-component system, cell cycle sensor histidine kinase and response regulator CckA
MSVSRILVVDDEPSIREFFTWVLTDAGHSVLAAADGVDALMVPGAFDLLVTDVMMPRMPGDELARQMRSRDPRVKVLFVTAYSDRLLDAKVPMWNGQAFLDKPVTVEELLEAVDELLNEDFDTWTPPSLNHPNT